MSFSSSSSLYCFMLSVSYFTSSYSSIFSSKNYSISPWLLIFCWSAKLIVFKVGIGILLFNSLLNLFIRSFSFRFSYSFFFNFLIRSRFSASSISIFCIWSIFKHPNLFVSYYSPLSRDQSLSRFLCISIIWDSY